MAEIFKRSAGQMNLGFEIKTALPRDVINREKKLEASNKQKSKQTRKIIPTLHFKLIRGIGCFARAGSGGDTAPCSKKESLEKARDYARARLCAFVCVCVRAF